MDETKDLGHFIPRQNPLLIGQDGAEQEFFKVVKSSRIHHAWLISGPKGIGKATFSYRIARFMLAQNTSMNVDSDQSLKLFPTNNNSCENQKFSETPLYLDPKHPVFRRVAAGSHADFLSIERGVEERTKSIRKEIIVEDVRSIGSFLNKTAAEAIWRVVVIDAVDEMNMSAANALLKVLEDPPKHALLLLVSHNPKSLLATIRSRCRELSLKPLDDFSITSILNYGTTQVEKEDLNNCLLPLCNGSVGLALELLENQGIEIFKSVNSLLSNLIDLDIPVLDSLCDEINRYPQDKAFRMLHLILSHWLSQNVKTAAIQGSRRASDNSRWINVWEYMNHLFHKAESVNLGRKQVILDTFLSIAAAAHDDSRGTI